MEVQDNFPESAVYLIPVRLDDCQLSYQKLEKIQYADMFPDWNSGLERIIQTIEIESRRDSKVVDEVKNKLESCAPSAIDSMLVLLNKRKS